MGADEQFKKDVLPSDTNKPGWRYAGTNELTNTVHTLPEHFYWRYCDNKRPPPRTYNVPNLSDCWGTIRYIRVLEQMGLIKVTLDTYQLDPVGGINYARCIQCRLEEGQTGGDDTGRVVLHGCHPMCVASILEAGGPQVSETYGFHEYTLSGMYCAPESETTAFQYASRCRILCRNERGAAGTVWSEQFYKPTTQFVFRGIEQPHGKTALDATKASRHNLRRERDFGGETQLIYTTSDLVKWTELQVWIGCGQRIQGEFAIFECPGGFEKSRRGSRLARPYLKFKSDPRWIPSDKECGLVKAEQEQKLQMLKEGAAEETSGSSQPVPTHEV